ncbi:ATP-binding protein [Corallococcus sp. AB045]|uniref:AlbA family DNA-binding domain-containing protein n=1 Tax=Corallococcus sp. AB045 TaxID=2316719 RepID=UPI000EDC0955|nr:ATP-binding protein [Corallococcus sp. AB045]RKH78801.1 ATP-binding protein [Corallococcus sp. AB045]
MRQSFYSSISDAEIVRGFVLGRIAESENLDFKGEFWIDGRPGKSASQEAGKDIAAFANSDGGSLVVGVSDRDDCASGFNTNFKLDGRKKQLEAWLLNELSPSAVASSVEIVELSFDVEGRRQCVLVVNVPPWPHGVVGVRWKDAGWIFPFRLGRDTKFLSLEEAMVRNDVSRRALYLRMGELMARSSPHPEYKGIRVRFSSPVVQAVVGEPGTNPKPVALALKHGCHGAIVGLERDCFLVRMNGVLFGYDQIPSGIMRLTDDMAIPSGQELVVPFEHVVAAWWGASAHNAINVSLNAMVYWVDDRWALYSHLS